MKCSRKVGSGPMNNSLNFVGVPDHRLDTGTVFRICHYWEIRKVVNRPSSVLNRQMAALVRRALAEVYTVTEFLVLRGIRVNDMTDSFSPSVFGRDLYEQSRI